MPPLAGDALPASWALSEEHVILDGSFDQGQRFLRAWEGWRAAPGHCKRLFYIALGIQAPDHGLAGGHHAVTNPLAERLDKAWPVLTPGLHTLVFDEGPACQLTLLLGVGDASVLVPQLVARIDVFRLDGIAPAPLAFNGDEGWLSRLARLASPGAQAVAAKRALNVLAGLAQSGFKTVLEERHAAAADLSILRFEPHHRAPPLAGGLWPTRLAPAQRHALIIGAGLAGCAAAWALARQGWRTTLIDAHPHAAEGASGNPGGLFHSVLHGDDGLHARAHRAAALRTAATLAPWLQDGRFAGACHGLLRLDATASQARSQALPARLGLPPEHVQWLNQAEASAAAGILVPHGGWLFHQGGWVDPAAYARVLLDKARQHADVAFLPRRAVAHIQRTTSAQGPFRWQAMGTDGHPIAEAPVVVLASAADTTQLIQALPGAADLPLSSVRGQISSLPLGDGTVPPRIPVAGAGYVLPAMSGRLLFGATSHANDPDPSVRDADHLHNLAQAAQLGSMPSAITNTLPPGIEGRVGWRAVTPDRLPYVGPLPLHAAPAPGTGKRTSRTDQPRFIPRLRDEHGGVYVITGFGSRGITWAALAGELLASWVTGSPSPLEAPLRDALDPARIMTRAKAREMSG